MIIKNISHYLKLRDIAMISNVIYYSNIEQYNYIVNSKDVCVLSYSRHARQHIGDTYKVEHRLEFIEHN